MKNPVALLLCLLATFSLAKAQTISDHIVSDELVPSVYEDELDNTSKNPSILLEKSACTCVEDPNGALPANLVACDNFESYNLGNIDPQAADWRKSTTAGTVDATVETHTGGKRLRFYRNGNTYTNVLYDISPYTPTQERYRLSWRMFIGGAGYYRIDHTPVSDNRNTAYRVIFNTQGQGELKLGGQSTIAKTFSYNNNAWNKIVQIIDRNSNQAELWINDTFVHSWDFRIGSITSANSNSIRGVAFEAVPATVGSSVNNYEYFVDDICVWQKNPNCTSTTNISPVCLKDGRQFDNISKMRCALYTPLEQGTCSSTDETDVCDLGGTFIYRTEGTNFIGRLDTSELVPARVLQSSCVLDYYLQQFDFLPSRLYADIYIFYNNDPGEDISVNLNAQDDRTTAVIYSCFCGTIGIQDPDGITSSNNCGQTCRDIGNNATVEDAPVGFYYIVIVSPVNDTYNFSVVPNGTCVSTTPINCGSTTTSTVNGEGNDYTTTGVNGTSKAYQTCYAGTRVYSGEDKEYKFQLDEPSTVDIRLNSTSAMGIFLYDFLCGENCIAAGQNGDSGGAATISGISLAAGVYYLVVDKATSSGNSNFTLSLDCQEENVFRVYFNSDLTCEKNETSVHEVTLKGLGATRLNNALINVGDQILFSALQYDPGSVPENPLLLQDYKSWNGNEIKLSLYEDAPDAGNVKCSYDDGEAFVIKVQRATDQNTTYEVQGSYQVLQAPAVTGGATFSAGKRSVITNLTQIDPPTTLRISPVLKAIPSAAGTFALLISTNEVWRIRETSTWITPNLTSGEGNAQVNLTLTANNTTLTRTDSVFVTVKDEDKRRLIVKQLGCTLTDAFAGNDQTVCQGSPVQLIATGGGTYQWNTGATTAQTTVTATSTASYIVSVTKIGCTDFDTVTVTVIPQPAPPINAGDKSICNGITIPALSVSIGVNQTVNWYNQATGGTLLATNSLTFQPTQAGTYYAEAVSNTGGCKSAIRTAVKLNISAPPTAFAGADTAICVGKNAQLKATASGGGGGYTFAWDQNLGSGALKTVNPTQSTLYNVTVTDANNCTSTDQVAITVNALPVANAGANQTICQGSPLPALTVTTSTGNLADWYDARTGSNKLATGTNIYTPTIAGTYYAEARNAISGCVSSERVAITLTINALPQLNAGADQQICVSSGATLTAIANGGSGSYTYNWDNNLGSGNTKTVNPNSTTNYRVTVTDGNNCSRSDEVIVQVNQNPVVELGPTQRQCQGDSLVLNAQTQGGSGVYTFQWSNGNVQQSQKIAVSQTTIYSISVTDEEGCKATDQVEIIANSLPIADAGADKSICQGENTSLNASATSGGGNYRFTWNNGLGAGASKLVQPTSTLTYVVTVTDANECTDTDDLKITVNDLPILTQVTTNCASNRLTYTITLSSNATSIRSNAGTVRRDDSQSFSILNIPAGQNVTITAINSVTGCEKNLAVAAPTCGCPAVSSPVSNGDRQICAGDSIPTLSVTVGPNLTVDWYDDLGNVVLNNSTIYKPIKAGIYFAQARNLVDNCTSTTPTRVELIQNPLPFANAGNDQTICKGSNVRLIASATGGTGAYTFFWNNDLGNGADKIVNPSINTTYKITVTDAKNCSSTDEVLVIVKPSPTLDLGADMAICAGDSIQIKANASGGSGSFSYNWGNNLGTGGNTRIVNPIATTTYALTLTDAELCTVTDQITIAVRPGVLVEVANIKNVNCFGENTGSAVLNIRSGTPPYQWQWSDGSQRTNGSNLPAGPYAFTITDQNNCLAKSAFVITQPTAIKLDSIVTKPTLASVNSGSIRIKVSGGTAPYTFRWTLGDVPISTAEDLDSLKTGNYLVQITDANGCILKSDTIKISSTTATQNETLAQHIQVFPNPTNGKVNVQIDFKNSQGIYVTVVDVLGKMVVRTTRLRDSIKLHELDLSAQPSGLYFIHIRTDQQFISKSIILSK